VQAVKDAEEVEYALNFVPESEPSPDVNAIHQQRPTRELDSDKLQDSLDQIVKRLEALETSQKPPPSSQQPFNYYARSANRGRGRGFKKQQYDYELCCWLCGEVGHLKRQCPLNYNGPVRRMGGWPRP